jgi:hypothetical protein
MKRNTKVSSKDTTVLPLSNEEIQYLADLGLDIMTVQIWTTIHTGFLEPLDYKDHLTKMTNSKRHLYFLDNCDILLVLNIARLDSPKEQQNPICVAHRGSHYSLSYAIMTENSQHIMHTYHTHNSHK